MNNHLPSEFVASGLRIAEGATLFGKRLMDLTREEAIAAAAQGWAAEKKAREECSQRTKALFNLLKTTHA
jgi:hypothetical protein